MGTRDNSRWRKKCYERSYDQRITVDHGEWCIWYDFETKREIRSILHMDLQGQVYKSRFMTCLRKNRLWHDILYWPVYINHRTTCTEWRGKMILHFRGSDCRRYLSSTWWIASWWIENLPRVKWVPTFKVECRRLGYVDDPQDELMEDVMMKESRMMFGIQFPNQKERV